MTTRSSLLANATSMKDTVAECRRLAVQALQVDPGNALERRPERKKRNYKVSPTSCATTKRSTRVRRPFFDDPEAGRKLAVAQYRRKIVRSLQGEIS